MKPAQRDTALLDLLAGWSEFIHASREDAEQPFKAFQEERGGNATEADYGAFRTHYSDAYAEHIASLYQLAGDALFGDAPITPVEFVRRHVLPLLEEAE